MQCLCAPGFKNMQTWDVDFHLVLSGDCNSHFSSKVPQPCALNITMDTWNENNPYSTHIYFVMIMVATNKNSTTLLLNTFTTNSDTQGCLCLPGL